MIDECHATGFLGKTGRGSAEYCGVPIEKIDIINSTLVRFHSISIMSQQNYRARLSEVLLEDTQSLARLL